MSSLYSDELKDRYPYVADYLATVFFEQGGHIHVEYQHALSLYLSSSSECSLLLKEYLENEISMFYDNFIEEQSRLDAFVMLGGAARNSRTLAIYLPQPELD